MAQVRVGLFEWLVTHALESLIEVVDQVNVAFNVALGLRHLLVFDYVLLVLLVEVVRSGRVAHFVVGGQTTMAQILILG